VAHYGSLDLHSSSQSPDRLYTNLT